MSAQPLQITPEQAAMSQKDFADFISKYPEHRDALVKSYQQIYKKPLNVPSRELLEQFNRLYRITPELAAKTPKEPPILTINDVTLMTRHSLVGLNGDINAGKTPLALLLACMAINPKCSRNEEIAGGIEMAALQGNILYFDTELETDMLCHVVRCSWEKRLNHQQADIQRLHYYPLRHIQTDIRLKMVEMLIDKIGDISFIVIDSLTQMVSDKMDFKEATRLVDGLFALIDKYKFPILATIHGNRGDDTGKATGHIGAVLQEKASTYLRLMYDPNDDTKDSRILTADFPNGKVRWGKKQKARAAFKWDKEMGGFLETEYIEPDKSKKPTAKQETQLLLSDLYRARPQDGYTFKDLCMFFVNAGMNEDTAKTRINRGANGWGLLSKSENGLYYLLN